MTKGMDIHQHITDRIVAAIEAGASPWQMPWHRGTGGKAPVNIESGKRYRGVNTLALWVEAQLNGYSSHLWGTYRQWAGRNAQVRKGAKATYVVFYREIEVAADAASESESETRLLARATPVFNADQIEGLEAGGVLASIESVEDIDAFVTRTGVVIRHGGARACFIPSLDEIHMPSRQAFAGSATSNATEAYYSTLLHELTHWTGVKQRCDRDLTGRFGTESYAMEELVAELGAAFLCAELGLAAEPRADHAQYLSHWLTVLKADKRAVFTAASKAAQAADYLRGADEPPSPERAVVRETEAETSHAPTSECVAADEGGWTPPIRDIETHDLVWRGMVIRISFEREFLGRGEPSPYNLSHLQIESIDPARAPLPVTGTGYRSHFIDYDVLMQRGGPLAYVQAWLEQEAQSPAWKARSAGEQLGFLTLLVDDEGHPIDATS